MQRNYAHETSVHSQPGLQGPVPGLLDLDSDSSSLLTEMLRRRVLTRSDVSTRRTRASESGQAELPRVRTEFAKRSFLYRAAKSINAAR